MIIKEIEIDNKKVLFAASAAIPRIYRIKFRRDIFKDMEKIGTSVQKNKNKQENEGVSDSDITIEDLSLFENVAYIMAEHAARKKGLDIPDNIDDWLDQFNTFSIYTVFPEIIKLWNLNAQTDAEAKKNFDQVAGK